MDIPKNFDWPLAYEGEKFIRARLAEFLANNSFARRLAARMHDETGTDFFEWVDHLVLSPDDETALVKAGFIADKKIETPNRAATVRERSGRAATVRERSGRAATVRERSGEVVLEHPYATLPRVLLRRGKANPSVVAIKPEFVADFIAANHLAVEPEGEPRSRYRRAVISTENGAQLEAVERRAYRGFVPAKLKKGELAAILKAAELFNIRPRYAETDAEGFGVAKKILSKALKLVGRDIACQLFFEAERAYWERRNRAARFQKFRQDTLGLGWGNHDHHTFRCSRAHFADLIHFLTTLGFQKRERFYAGAEAGWGAQISEQPVTGIVVFADVDLMPEETSIDFSVKKLPPAPRLGTVGLWTSLHGDSFLQAGMHHLEARFDFASLRDQLQSNGLNLMKPFSDFEFLRQAFTEGDRWQVNPERVEHLAAAGLITPEQREKFLREGAIGSHLENLQRHGGFKGFNQKSVSAVISATDPRKQSHATPA